MAEASVCLEFSAHGYHSSPAATAEEDYQALFKPFFSFLYSHPGVPFSLSFSTSVFSFLEKKHPESLEILRELNARRQVEFVGSAYHDPILPLLFPIDRSAQIEKMSSAMRSFVGKRPRGMSLAGSVWDYSLVTSLDSCGMEYVELDAGLVPSSSRLFYPLITGGLGKRVKILCVHPELAPHLGEGEDAPAWSARIRKTLSRFLQGDESPVVVISFDPPRFKDFFASGFFSSLPDAASSLTPSGGTLSGECFPGIRFTLPQLYLRGAKVFTPCYIPAGMDWTLAQWARKAFRSCENRSRFPLTIYDYLNCYSDSRNLYDRMMYISMLLSQGHGGDKVLKNLAKEKLWEAQGFSHYVSLPSGLPATSQRRQEAYKLLNEAELLIRRGQERQQDARGAGERRASIISYDYNRDGINEYLCSLKLLRLVIARRAAQIVEFDNISNGCNYASSLSRIAAFDGADDGYRRGFFADLFFPGKAAAGCKSLQDLMDAAPPAFSRLLFDEKKLDLRRNEILFSARAVLPGLAASLSLLKKYTVLDDGLSIQYILRNDGDRPLSGVFAVESNFAQTSFSKKAGANYSCELVLDGGMRCLEAGKAFLADGRVSALRVTDCCDKLQFTFEPNEEAGFATDTLSFRRPDAYGAVGEDSKTLVCAFFWKVELPAGRSAEKNISFSVTRVPGRKKSPAPPSASL